MTIEQVEKDCLYAIYIMDKSINTSIQKLDDLIIEIDKDLSNDSFGKRLSLTMVSNSDDTPSIGDSSTINISQLEQVTAPQVHMGSSEIDDILYLYLSSQDQFDAKKTPINSWPTQKKKKSSIEKIVHLCRRKTFK